MESEVGVSSAAETDNFMDFSDAAPASAAAVTCISRPQLSVDRQTVYEDTTRSGHVLAEMHRLYLTGRLCDVVLRVESERIPCHRLVMAASSVYFERMFSNDMTESRSPEVRINGVTAGALQRLVEFAYSSLLPVSGDTVLDTFEASDMLEFPRARHFCEEFLSDMIDVNNCVSFLLYADAYTSTVLYERSVQCITKNFQTVCMQREFLDLPMAQLTHFLKDDNVEVEYEEYVYEALKRWVLNDESARLSDLPTLFANVRLNFVSRWYLIDIISNDELLATSAECKRLIRSAKDQLLAVGHTYEIPWQLPPSRRRTGLTSKLVYIATSDPHPGESPVLLFDAVNRSWSRAGRACPLASEFSTCVAVNGESLLVVGGWTNRIATRSLKDGRGAVATAHEFRVMSIFPTLWYVGAHAIGISRYLHSTATVGEKIFLLGGYDETQSLQASVFVADTSGGYHFEACRRMLYPVSRPAVATLNDKLYAFGGYDRGGSPVQVTQCFDISSQTWTELPGVPGPRSSCEFAIAIDDLFYVLCGTASKATEIAEHPMLGVRVAERSFNAVWTFDPIAARWTPADVFPEPRFGSFSMAAMKEKIYITGGQRGARRTACRTIECYNPRADTLEVVGTTGDEAGILSLCTSLCVMHENFGL